MKWTWKVALWREAWKHFDLIEKSKYGTSDSHPKRGIQGSSGSRSGTSPNRGSNGLRSIHHPQDTTKSRSNWINGRSTTPWTSASNHPEAGPSDPEGEHAARASWFGAVHRITPRPRWTSLMELLPLRATSARSWSRRYYLFLHQHSQIRHFQLDNSRSHSALVMREFLAEQEVNVLGYPASSPDPPPPLITCGINSSPTKSGNFW